MQRLLFLSITTLLASALHAEPKKAAPVMKPLDPATSKSIGVKLDGKEFTNYVYQGVPKPVLFPIAGAHGIEMTRNWPLGAAKPGEELDHPHHQSLWFAHGDVNGVDFWTIGEKAGKIIVQGQPVSESKNGITTISSAEKWNGPDDKTLLTSKTSLQFSSEGETRMIDYSITLTASEGEVTFGDTKEGTMALRVRPELNLPNKKGIGTITNSEGQSGQEVWGKNAAWVDYSATIEGKAVGVAVFDHPSNLRHPTTWHARDYGLLAANPFGLHDFKKAAKGAGNHVLKKGESLTFRYLWVFHPGDVAAAALPAKFAAWAKATK